MREGYAELDGVRLHYVEQGEGPLVVLLHGFPEFWYGWRHQIEPLADAGFRVVAPDMRGYNLSSKPRGVASYDIGLLAQDVEQLIEERGEQKAHVAGHDWGGAVAWAAAGFHPEVVERLAILNAPHPRVFIEHLKSPRQLARSWYMGFFQLPWLPEQLGRRVLPRGFPPAERARYEEAYAQPGALTAMFNYYRAMSRDTPLGRAAAHSHRPRAHAGDLGRTRPLPRPRPGRAAPRRRAQSRAGDSARHLALGPTRGAGGGSRTAGRVLLANLGQVR